MKKVDYSKLGDLILEESGFLSSLGMMKAAEFLRYLDSVCYVAYNRIITNLDYNKNDEVLINKILVILNNYLINYREDKNSTFMKMV